MSSVPLPAPRFTLRPLRLVLAIGLAFGLVISPLLLPMMQAARTTPELQTGLEQSVTLSADLLAFVLPSEMHPLWGAWAASIAQNFSTTLSERLIFAGFTPLALAVLAIVRYRRRRLIQFWTLSTAAFFVLALGPYLHFGGQIVSLGGWPIPMPYWLLYHTVPFIGLTRSLSRYDLMVMLGLGVLAAVALAHLAANRQPPTADHRPSKFLHSPLATRHSPLAIRHSPFAIRHSPFAIRHSPFAIRHLLPLLAALLTCFEFLAVPYPISKIDTPPFYFDLAAQPGDFTIAELPMNWDRPSPMLYQTVHGKRLLTAYTSRDNPLELAWRTPVLQHWRYLGPDIIDQPLPQIAPTIFYDFNLRYIVLDYYQMPPGPERAATERWVAAALPGAAPIYSDGRLKVYQTPPKIETQPYLSLGNGWSKRQEDAAGTITRTILANGAELFLHHPQNQPLTLKITAAAAGPSQRLTILAAGQPVSTISVNQTGQTQTINLPSWVDPLVPLTLNPAQPNHPITVYRINLQAPKQ